MKLFKLFAVTLMLWPYLGIALLYLPEDAAPYLFFSLYLLLTVAVYGINIVNACRWKGEAERLAFWNMLIKLVHIPFHLLLFLVGLILILAMVVPALVFVSPILVMIFSIISWLLVLTSSVYGINAIVRGRQIGALSTKTAILLGILHLLFLADCKLSERMTKNKKMKKREKSRKTLKVTWVPAFIIFQIVILDASKNRQVSPASL